MGCPNCAKKQFSIDANEYTSGTAYYDDDGICVEFDPGETYLKLAPDSKFKCKGCGEEFKQIPGDNGVLSWPWPYRYNENMKIV